jgi:ligand-binding sensor domain-containing protein
MVLTHFLSGQLCTRKLIFAFFLVQFLFSTLIVSAQEHLRFNHLTSDQGLSSNSINCILKDHTGFLWIGTNAGLNRFDGNTVFTYFHRLDDSTSLPNDDINCLFEDARQRIWVGTKQGLSILYPESEKFINYSQVRIDTQTIDFSEDLMAIGQFANQIWLVTRTKIIVTPLDTIDFRIVFSELPPHKKASGYFFPKCITSTKNRIWFLSSHGPVYTEDGKQFYARFNNPNQWPIFNTTVYTSAMMCDGDSLLYFATPDFNGLFSYHINTRQFDSISFGHQPGSEHTMIFSLSQQQHHEIWGSTISDGLVSFNTITRELHFYRSDKNNPNAISTNQSNQILLDELGTVFVATDRGLNYSNSLQPIFKVINTTYTELAGLSVSVAEDDQGVLWLATWRKGLFSYDPVTGSIEQYTFPGDYNIIWALNYDQGELLLETEGGLAAFSISSKKFRKIEFHHSPFLENLTKHRTIFMQKDHSDNFWIGYYDGGILNLNYKTGEYFHFSVNDSIDPLPNRFISSITIDEHGNLWALFTSNDILHLNTKDNSFTTMRIPGVDHIKGQGPSMSIQSDLHGFIWIALSHVGLVRFNSLTNQFRIFDTRDRLSSTLLGSIIIDNSNAPWISTATGINKFDPATETFTLYNRADGLNSNQFDSSPMFKSRSGMIYVWSDHSILNFDPSEILPNPNLPTLILSSYKKSGESFSISPEIKELKFNHKDKNISFEFNGINFIDPSKTQYAYYLEGFDEDWNNLGSKNSVTYTALPAGVYTLRIKATNKFGMWDVPEKVIVVHVSGPFWLKWWFILSCIALGMGLVYMIKQYQFLQFKKIQAIRNRISKDLHDDIGSTLSSISINSMAVERMNAENFPEIISTVKLIGQNARTAMENMSDIVWAINPKNDTFQNMMDRLQIFAIRLLEAKDIQLQFDIPEALQSIKLSLPQRKNIYLILREAIHNVAKYSQATQCIVSAKLENKKIDLEVKDDGQGFGQTTPGLGGNGLVNMRERADELKAHFQIHSEKLKGTRVSLQLAYN